MIIQAYTCYVYCIRKTIALIPSHSCVTGSYMYDKSRSTAWSVATPIYQCCQCRCIIERHLEAIGASSAGWLHRCFNSDRVTPRRYLAFRGYSRQSQYTSMLCQAATKSCHASPASVLNKCSCLSAAVALHITDQKLLKELGLAATRALRK